MPSLEQRVTTLEAAMVNRTAELHELRARQDNRDACVNSLADAFMEHRGEVAARFDRVDSDIAALKSGQEELRAGQEELRAGQEELRAGQEGLRSTQTEMRDLLNRIVAKVEG